MTIVEDDGAPPDDSAAPALLRQADGALRSAFVAAGLCARVAREGTRFSDIALLARRRSTLPLLELALDRLNVPFVVAGRALYATPEVRDLFAALRLQIDPSDRHALAHRGARAPRRTQRSRASRAVHAAARARPSAGLVARAAQRSE